MSDLGRALVDALDDAALERLVERLGPRLLELLGSRVTACDEDRWLTTAGAATYLGMSVNAVHKLTAARSIPFEQDARGGKCWFLKSELDAWRRAGGCFPNASTVHTLGSRASIAR